MAERYNLPHMVLDDLIEEIRNADSETGKLVRDKLAEIEAALANPKGNGPYFVPSAVLAKVVLEAVATKPSLYRGYVLSGFPQFLEDATELFLEERPAPPGAEPVVEEPKDKKGKKVEEGPKMIQVPRLGFLPDGVALVHSPEESCLARLRAKDLPEEQWMPTFKKKMERWQKENADGAAGLADFFQTKISLEPVVVNEPVPPPADAADGGAADEGAAEARALTVDYVFDIAACELSAKVEAVKEVNNLMPPPPGPKGMQAEVRREEVPAEDEAKRKRDEEELRRKREREEKLEQIKRDELSKLEKHSEPLRQYLMSFVVPTITSGLVEVCRTQPDDPVGYLAEYLAAYAQLSRKRSKAFRGSSSAASPGGSVGV